MNREDYVLSVLATSQGASFTPVQVQKLLFVLDKEIPKHINGPHFNFVPYDYGPFDVDVYETLEHLSREGSVDIDYSSGTRRRVYRLTVSGQEKGDAILKQLPQEVKVYLQKLSVWIRSQSFEQLVAAIYRRYPDMKSRSIFRG